MRKLKLLDIPILRKYKKVENPKCVDCIHHRPGENLDDGWSFCGLHGGYWKRNENWCSDFERAKE